MHGARARDIRPWRGAAGGDPMFRLSALFGRRPQLAPSNPVIDPAVRAGVAPGTVPGAAGEPSVGRGPRAASARALDLAETLRARGVEVPVLMQRFPHVVDRIASAWSDPVRLAAVFEELLLDDRGGRQGFPADAAAELFAIHRVGQGGWVEPLAPPATPR